MAFEHNIMVKIKSQADSQKQEQTSGVNVLYDILLVCNFSF